MNESPGIDWDRLRAAADSAREHAHAPYSRFRVGAAIQTRDGGVHAGCNVENASYGLTVCAERVAIGAGVTAGDVASSESVVAVWVTSEGGVSPCGACRQVLSEFARGAVVRCLDLNSGTVRDYSMAELLPAAFEFTWGSS